MKLFLIILLLPLSVFSQTSTVIDKPIVYLNENDSIISQKDFDKQLHHAVNIEGYYETDTTFVAKLYTRSFFDSISPGNNQKIREYVSMLTGNKPEDSDIIIIQFYSGLRNRISDLDQPYWKKKDKDYVRGLPKSIKKQVKAYYIYHHDFSPEDSGAKKWGWVYDKNRLIEYAFFPIHFNYNNTIVIMPDGKTFTYYGEHGPDQIKEGLKELVSQNND
ncbi:hypothetical protein [Flavobacterium rhizosphaerae]|uniref:Uncharacterized protein n=1 Tax=Flavobacterium rhizosphaerae TaxID=3163298 RepID=A0ABW8YSU0_9FLAO